MSLSLAVVSLTLVIADLANSSARAWMRAWEAERRIGDFDRWDAAHERLKLAHRLSPLNADYSADLGRLMEWQSWRALTGSAQAADSRDLAARYYEETIGKRPSWGFAWAHYAENRLLSGKSDSRFVAALDRAMSLAPWEPGVQQKIAWMGMASWNGLPADVRERVEESVRRSVTLEWDLEDLVRMAIQYDWLDRLEPMMRTQRQLLALERVRGQGKSR